MKLEKICYCITGSFCTFSRSLGVLRRLVESGYSVTPVMSENAYYTDTRFFGAEEFTKEQTKTYNSTRIHELPDYLLELIGTGEPDAYVVPMVAQTITKTLKRLVKRSCGKDVTFHQLRHVFATTGAMLNLPPKVMQEMGGWKTPHTMEKVYQHTFRPEREAAQEAIDKYFEQILKDS